MASSCAMHDRDTGSACSCALWEVARRSPGRLANGFHGGRCWILPAGGQRVCHLAGTRIPPSFDLALAAA